MTHSTPRRPSILITLLFFGRKCTNCTRHAMHCCSPSPSNRIGLSAGESKGVHQTTLRLHCRYFEDVRTYEGLSRGPALWSLQVPLRPVRVKSFFFDFIV